MRKRNFRKKATVWILTGAMMFTLLPSNVYAQEVDNIEAGNNVVAEVTTEASTQKQAEPVTEELPEQITEVTTEDTTESTDVVATENTNSDTIVPDVVSQEKTLVEGVQERIDALPTVEEFQAMSDGSGLNTAQMAVYEEAQAICDIMDGMTPEEAAQIDTRKLENLMNYWNRAVEPMLDASDLETSVSRVNLYPSGCLKSIQVGIRDKGSHKEAYGKIAIYNALSVCSWDNRWSTSGSSWPAVSTIKSKDSGFMAFGDGAEFKWTDKQQHNSVVSFSDGQIDLKKSGTYYVYLCTKSSEYGTYPDAMLKTLVSKNGQLYIEGESTPIEQEHTHTWSYQSNGNLISATCSNSSCKYHTTPVSVKLNTSKATYTGKSYTGASITNGNSVISDRKFPVTGATISSITYSGTMLDGTVYEESTTAPVNAGNYKAAISVTSGGATVKVTSSFVVAPKPVSLKWSDLVFTYDGKEHVPTAAVNASDLCSGDRCAVVSVSGQQSQAGHDYVATAAGLDNSNYVIADAATTFRIQAGTLTLTVKDQKKHMDEDDPEYTYEITGDLVDGDEIKGITFERTPGEDADTYTVAAKEIPGSNPNYNIIMVNGTLTIEPHEPVVDKAINATCTTSGLTEGSHCAVCQKTLVPQETIPALSHDWSGDWNVVVAATENKAGKQEKTCQRKGCGQKKYDIIPATGTEENPDENPDENLGQFEKDAEISVTSPIKEATLNNKKSEFINNPNNIFSQEEKEEIQNGADAKVWLEISELDMSTLSAEDKARVLDKAKEIMGNDTNITYFDVNLFKQMTGSDKVEIAKSGMPIFITIKIPDHLINRDEMIQRKYQILRLHDGQVDVIDGTFDAQTNEFTFMTDKFSTYAIVYTDTQKEKPSDDKKDDKKDDSSGIDHSNSGNGQNIKNTTDNKQKNKSDSRKSKKIAATGDTAFGGFAGWMLLLSSLGIVLLYRKKREPIK